MHYIDHFSVKSVDYKQFRPVYPADLYKYLSDLTKKHELAWDCGTGNGQAAVQLSQYYKQVIGSDISKTQLDVAEKKENIFYYCWPSENTGLSDGSVDLVTVAQALHWFNLEGFYQEVRRVARKNGVLAVWCYSLGTINDEIDVLIRKLYSEILGDTYWPKERRYIDNEYQTIAFPFKKIETPDFRIEKNMNFMQLIGYLNTWSAVKEYQQVNQENPINLIYTDLQKAWGDPDLEHKMNWPIHMLAGYVSKL